MKEIVIKIYKTYDNPINYLLFLTDYYLPIIGNDAYYLYLYLFNLDFEKINEDELLIKTHFDNEKFISTKKILEGIGLISSYIKENELIIVINKVLTPSHFFNKTHLRFLLLSSLNNNEEEVEKIEKKYINKYSLNGYLENSATLFDVFKIRPEKETKKIRLIKKDYEEKNLFSYAVFLKYIQKNSQLNSKSFSENDLNKIENISKIYSLNENEIGQYIINFYDPTKKENKIDYNSLEKKVINDQLVSVPKENKANVTKSKDDLIIKVFRH